MWGPFFFIFFSGLSWHVAAALVAHMVGYDSEFTLPLQSLLEHLLKNRALTTTVQWGSTLKEVEISNCALTFGHQDWLTSET